MGCVNVHPAAVVKETPWPPFNIPLSPLTPREPKSPCSTPRETASRPDSPLVWTPMESTSSREFVLRTGSKSGGRGLTTATITRSRSKSLTLPTSNAGYSPRVPAPTRESSNLVPPKSYCEHECIGQVS